jgi:TolA-binding protein
MWQQRRSIKDLDLALHEAQSRWIRVDHARKSVPNNNGEFAARVADLKARIEALQGRLAETQKKQTGYLAQLAIQQLDEQKDRLAAYQVQARFALASMYDRAANEDQTHKKEPGAAVPKSSQPDADTPAAPPSDKTPAPDAAPPAAPPSGTAPPDAGTSGSPKP